jgi:long-chain acyl-CoA synthetase
VIAASGESVTYGDLDRASNQGAQLLHDLGLRPGDHIALFMENHPRFFEICWAAQRSGLIYTPVSSRLTAPEVECIVRDCGAKVLIGSHAHRDVADKLIPRRPRTPSSPTQRSSTSRSSASRTRTSGRR